ncbi:lipid-binding SYLF domain-containing protein [Geomonas sp.]|uniref:lipid-binding SYLF domain-containing protein n=1 Tax=Geomonas sp. TaxID=2651584 RepID=UPI002B464F47|nr:lipid-binding SYLF domain-containing protein [Geomonas sp.]HJV36996.1 lipid-binding SYLF domain-containing protein [Geomonas sp.]
MKIGRSVSLVLVALLLVGAWATAALARNEAKDVRDSADVLKEVMKIPEKGIPPALLKDAKAVVIIPDTIKGAFIVGGQHGTGVLMVRKDNGQWSDPLFISISGASVGWQIGGKATDLILVFKNKRGVEGLLKGTKFTLGADASVAAGPVGRDAQAATDAMLKSEILSYSRTRGLFGGVSLEGAVLLVSKDANAHYYGKSLTSQEVIGGMGGKKSPATKRLQDMLNHYSRM